MDSRDGKRQIQVGETVKVSAFIQAPHRKCKKSIKFLFYYNIQENYPQIK